MTLTVPFRFAVVLYGEDGAEIGTVPVVRDFEPAYEWTRFNLQRRGELGLRGDGCASTVIPVFDSNLGEPYCRGFRIEIVPSQGRPVGSVFPNTFFREYVAAVASKFAEQKRLRAGETYTYLVVAYSAAAEKPGTCGLTVTDASPGLPVQDGALQDFFAWSKPRGVIDSEDMPVFVSQQVLEEAAARTHAEKGTETGGILIGKLRRDTKAREIFVEVCAQIPCEHTIGSEVKLTFTPQTWAAASAALRLRDQGEILLGYWHSHPVFKFCENCTPEKQKTCRLAKDFFSADDAQVMAAVFSPGYSVAIVANDTAFTDLTFSMFTNNRGMMAPRGFYVLEEKTHGA